MSKPTFISLFAGIGGIDLGLERAGFECVAQVEWDDYCQSVLTKHWPNVPKFRDIKDVTDGQLPRADVVAGGFPCQPVSVGGKQKAQADERWLWPEFARVVCMVRPRVVFMENVPGLLTANAGDAFGEVQRDLASLGYDSEWEVIPATAFGALHLRKRVALVAYANSPELWEQSGRSFRPDRKGPPLLSEHGEAQPLADATSTGRPSTGRPSTGSTEAGAASSGRTFSDPSGRRLRGGRPWASEPDVGRVAHGVPDRLDRLKALGNAVVPQFAEYVGDQIMREFFSSDSPDSHN